MATRDEGEPRSRRSQRRITRRTGPPAWRPWRGVIAGPRTRAEHMEAVNVAVLGAGPHGLAATAHLRRAGVDVHVVGEPMSFWHTMPTGMLLRSNWTATCIAEYQGPLSLDA